VAWVRDMDFDEGQSQVRTASGPASWQRYATSPSRSCGSPPASLPPCDAMPAGQPAPTDDHERL